MANNQLNWFHFKPDFSGKPKEDGEAHLLRTMDCMTTQDFPENQKVRRFCFTLLGEAKLWYATLNIQLQQLNGKVNKTGSGNNTSNLAILESIISMHGDPSNLMKQLI